MKTKLLKIEFTPLLKAKITVYAMILTLSVIVYLAFEILPK
jgi:hypothetical protein